MKLFYIPFKNIFHTDEALTFIPRDWLYSAVFLHIVYLCETISSSLTPNTFQPIPSVCHSLLDRFSVEFYIADINCGSCIKIELDANLEECRLFIQFEEVDCVSDWLIFMLDIEWDLLYLSNHCLCKLEIEDAKLVISQFVTNKNMIVAYPIPDIISTFTNMIQNKVNCCKKKII